MGGMDLKVRRIQAGLKQYEVAAELGIPQSTLSYYENDRRPIPDHMQPKILAVIEKLRRRKIAARTTGHDGEALLPRR